MSTHLPQALRLADVLDTTGDFQMRAREAAAELRRLYAANQELLEALKPFAVYGRPGSRDVEVGAAIAAITKATGECRIEVTENKENT